MCVGVSESRRRRCPKGLGRFLPQRPSQALCVHRFTLVLSHREKQLLKSSWTSEGQGSRGKVSAIKYPVRHYGTPAENPSQTRTQVPEALALRKELCALWELTQPLLEEAVSLTALLLRPHTRGTFSQVVLTPTPPK